MWKQRQSGSFAALLFTLKLQGVLLGALLIFFKEDFMIKVKFYDSVEDNLLKFAVIVSRHNGKWVLCQHKQRDTYEFPGGHRENGEDIFSCARRELWEETGAVEYDLSPVCVYSVVDDSTETFGMLYFAEIFEFEQLPQLEIARLEFFRQLPAAWTYPLIQPKLVNKVKEIFDI